jgi:hypothetical protein
MQQLPEWCRKDEETAAYFSSLPPQVQNFLLDSRVEIDTLGELMQTAEHLKGML